MLRTNQLKYYAPKYTLVKYQKSFKYVGVKIWNNLDLDLKQLSFTKLKNSTKTNCLKITNFQN